MRRLISHLPVFLVFPGMLDLADECDHDHKSYFSAEWNTKQFLHQFGVAQFEKHWG
jgi:hypothetical protein